MYSTIKSIDITHLHSNENEITYGNVISWFSEYIGFKYVKIERI